MGSMLDGYTEWKEAEQKKVVNKIRLEKVTTDELLIELKRRGLLVKDNRKKEKIR